MPDLLGFGWSLAVPGQGDAPDALLARADQSLYQAKREGRSRVSRRTGIFITWIKILLKRLD